MKKWPRLSRRRDSVRFCGCDWAQRIRDCGREDEARVTQAVHNVRLLASNSATRPASVGDNVRPGTAVRTGSDSRAELAFTDRTLARLGANSVLGFGEGENSIWRMAASCCTCRKVPEVPESTPRLRQRPVPVSQRWPSIIPSHGSNLLSSKVTAASLSNIIPARIDHFTQGK